MSSLKFFKGKKAQFPTSGNREPYSFYMVEDTNDFYYTDQYCQKIRLSADPSTTIKEIYTYYNTNNNVLPNTYPVPTSSGWVTEEPIYYDGNQIYKTKCILYMDDHYEFSTVEELITHQEIDDICGVS